MSWGDLAVVMVLVVLWASVAVRADRAGITARWCLRWPAWPSPATGTAHHLVVGEHQADRRADTRPRALHRRRTHPHLVPAPGHRPPAAAPRIGLPLTVLLGALAAHLFFGQPGIWMVVLISACLRQPTPAWAADRDQRVGAEPGAPRPQRGERLNDGIVAPLVSLAVAVLAGQAGEHGGPIALALREILIGAAIASGRMRGRLAPRLRGGKGLTSGGAAAVAMARRGDRTYALAEAASGNGFVGRSSAACASAPSRGT